MKTCTKCNIEKELTEFYKESRTKDGHRNQCKACRDSSRTDRKGENAAIYAAYMRKHRKEHPLSQKQKDQGVSRSLKHRYGITLEEYHQILESQGGHCLLCPRRTDNGRRLCVDHCHTSGKVRGILCAGHNAAIAILDNPKLFSRAMAYLGKIGQSDIIE
jgi:hypothetical protein